MADNSLPFEGQTVEDIGIAVFRSLLDQDIPDTHQMHVDFLEKTGRPLTDLCEIIANRFAQWSPSITSASEVKPETLALIIIQSIEDIIPMQKGIIDPIKTILLLQLPEFVSAIALPFLLLQSVRIKACMFAQDGLLQLMHTLKDEHVQILMQRYPSALEKATAHMARAVERQMAAKSGFKTEI